MVETSQFSLPLLSSGQAQKTVTVNEALSVLDAVAQLRFVSASLSSPPAVAADGDAFALPVGVSGAWFGHDGDIAISANGSWRFVTPKLGWHAFNLETGSTQLFDGTAWLDSTLAASTSGTATEYGIAEVDHVLEAGPNAQTALFIPANAQVVGVTGRVTSEITGSLASWSLGVDDGASNIDHIRYGQNLGLQLNSYVVGMTGAPTTYYSEIGLHLLANGGDFATGSVRLAAHYVTLVPPRVV